ncbi:MAG: tetratricopeptide repeat protein [Planctomycetota bacterium]
MDQPAARPSLERWTALALLLPPLVLAWPGPGSVLEDDFIPHATGAGAAALAALPAAVLLALRPASTKPKAFLLLALVGLAGALAARSASDSFEARRLGVHFATCLVLFFGGASLSIAGRRIYALGSVCVSLLLVAFAFPDKSNAFAGALGNTGSIAMAALPGALVAAVLLFSEKGAWRVVCGVSLGLYLAYVASVPVVAGGFAAVAVIAAFALTRARRSRVILLPLTVAAAVAAVAFIPSSTQVRTRVWSASLGMIRDHPWLGVGPGQFAAAFPPYRDPVEIEISTHHRALPVETEVEHPHQDWMLPAIEFGVVGGLAWIAFLLLVAGGAWRAMREEPGPKAALGAAAMGVLAYALVHAPLTFEPAAASIAFVAFGSVLSRPGRAWTWPLLVVLLAASLPARAFVRHGRWLASIASPDAQDARTVERALESALNCCHDSVVGAALLARLHEEKGSDPATVARHWSGVLQHHPHNVEALMQLALARVKSGDFAGARQAYERARALDPGHPGIRKNLRLLDLQEGALEKEADPSAESCYARSKQERAGGDALLADLLEARAHLLWAREHAEAGRFADAVRSYRQCLRVTGGAPRVRLELAAALAADGREDEARSEIAGVRLTDADRAALPAWAAEWCRRLHAGG